MEKDIGKIRKNDNTDIIIRIDDFGGKLGLTIREFTSTDRYTGFTKSGTRIPIESLSELKELINSIDESEIQSLNEQTKNEDSQSKFTSDRKQKKLVEEDNREGREESEGGNEE